MSTRIPNLNSQLTEEEIYKFDVLNSMGQFDAIVFELKKSIRENYKKIYDTSAKKTLRNYFAEHIAEIVNDNQSYGLPDVISLEKYVKIEAGYPVHNIQGFVKNCKNPDALILEVNVQKNVPALKFFEFEGTWEEVSTTLIHFKTSVGEYLYVSVQNALKNKESAEAYLKRVDNHYYYKNRDLAIA